MGFLFLQFFCACGNEKDEKLPAAENDVDAARNFIRAALDGHYDEAREIVLQDSVNNAWIDLFKRAYQSRLSLSDKAGYRNASINISEVRTVTDSTTIVRYSNSFKKQNDSVKVVRRNGEWLVDLKYSFSTLPTNTRP